MLRRKGLTQAQAAKLLHTGQGVVSYYAKLRKPPGRKTLAHIVSNLGIEPEDLVGQVDNPNLETGDEKRIPSALKEEGTMYRILDEYEHDDRVVWMERLRERWRRYPQEQPKIELALRTALPDDADRIIVWLRFRRE